MDKIRIFKGETTFPEKTGKYVIKSETIWCCDYFKGERKPISVRCMITIYDKKGKYIYTTGSNGQADAEGFRRMMERVEKDILQTDKLNDKELERMHYDLVQHFLYEYPEKYKE